MSEKKDVENKQPKKKFFSIRGWLKKSFITSNVDIVKNSTSSKVIEQNYTFLKNMTLKNLRGEENQEENTSPLSFWEGMNKYGIDNLVEIEIAYQESAKKFYTYLVLSAVFLLIGCYYFFVYGKLQGIITTGALSFLMIVMSISESLSCYRFKKQEISPISEWRKSGEFFPARKIQLADQEERERYRLKILAQSQNKKK